MDSVRVQGHANLVFANVQFNQSGVYVCTATHTITNVSISARAMLQVLGTFVFIVVKGRSTLR